MIELKKEYTQSELKQFAGIWFPAFCGMVGFLVYRHSSWPTLAYGIWGAGVVLGAVGVVWPPLIKPIYQGLLYATFPIGFVMSHLLLGLVYYAILTPIGLIMKLFGRDPLDRRLEPQRATYWVPHQTPANLERYFRQY